MAFDAAAAATSALDAAAGGATAGGALGTLTVGPPGTAAEAFSAEAPGGADSRPVKIARAAGEPCVDPHDRRHVPFDDTAEGAHEAPAAVATEGDSGAAPPALDAASDVRAISLLSDDDADSDHDSHAGGRRGGSPGGRAAGGGRSSSGKKRGRGGSPSASAAPKVKAVSKAAQRRAEKAAASERAGYEAAYAAAMRTSLSVKLPPVPPGTVRRQLKHPTEDNLAHWSHHCGCSTVADTILAACGEGLVSFSAWRGGTPHRSLPCNITHYLSVTRCSVWPRGRREGPGRVRTPSRGATHHSNSERQL